MNPIVDAILTFTAVFVVIGLWLFVAIRVAGLQPEQQELPMELIRLEIKEEMKVSPDDPRHILQFFRYDHLPKQLQAVSKPFRELAYSLVYGDKELGLSESQMNPELEAALRKLLEAKDAAVRSKVAGY